MVKNIFLREKPVAALVALTDKSRVFYVSMLSKEIDVTYAHLIKLLDEMAEDGLVEFEKEGRVKAVRLTDRGEELAHELSNVMRRLEK